MNEAAEVSIRTQRLVDVSELVVMGSLSLNKIAAVPPLGLKTSEAARRIRRKRIFETANPFPGSKRLSGESQVRDGRTGAENGDCT
jgi:hypothetical protein